MRVHVVRHGKSFKLMLLGWQAHVNSRSVKMITLTLILGFVAMTVCKK